MKFNALTLTLTALFFALTGEPQDPITLRLVLAILSGAATATLYCGLTQDIKHSTAITVPMAIVLFATTISDPDPSLIQMLLAFLVCPIIAFIAIKQEINHEAHPLVEQAPKPGED